MRLLREGSRCVDCNTVCENCTDSCPNRANVVIKLADGRHEIVHIDKMCNECGNCTHYCPYASEPCHDKFTLFQTAEDFVDSKNAAASCSWMAIWFASVWMARRTLT